GVLFAVDPITPADIATQQRVADYLLAAKVIPHKVDAAKAAWTGWTPVK
ncbi:aliphatic sulfonate ABC transporter substrate-binding protein, partial [Pseudomonas sp. MPR-R2A6]